MTITITPEMLCSLLPKFSYDACVAICDYYDECGSDVSPSIGDISICFYEVEEEDLKDENEEMMLYKLDNGKYLFLR